VSTVPSIPGMTVMDLRIYGWCQILLSLLG